MIRNGPQKRQSKERGSIVFKRVKSHDEDIQTLYKLLDFRGANISHKALPSLEEHRKFVLKHPYRFWYIVKKENLVLGSVYFHFDNSIGINMPRQSSENIAATLEKALCIHRPLQAKKSVRPNMFFINTKPQDRPLEVALKRLGWNVLQLSYASPNHSKEEVKNV
jgi:hypothetical protein